MESRVLRKRSPVTNDRSVDRASLRLARFVMMASGDPISSPPVTWRIWAREIGVRGAAISPLRSFLARSFGCLLCYSCSWCEAQPVVDIRNDLSHRRQADEVLIGNLNVEC